MLDILRTLLQTAVAAGAGPHEYLVDVLKADPADIEAHPEPYAPLAWVKRRRLAQSDVVAAPMAWKFAAVASRAWARALGGGPVRGVVTVQRAARRIAAAGCPCADTSD